VRLSNVAVLWWIRLRAGLGPELLALFGIGTGVALLFAGLVAGSSLTGSFERATEGVVGNARFQLTARGATFEEETLRKVRRLPGVAAATAMLAVPTEMGGPAARRSVLLLGIMPSFERMHDTLAARAIVERIARLPALSLPDSLASSLGARVGRRIAVDVDGIRVKAPFATRLPEQTVGPLISSPVAITPLPYAQKMSGQQGKVSRILILPEPDRDALVERGLDRLAGTRLDVRSAGFEAVLFQHAVEASSQATSIFSALSALVGFLLAFSAVLLTAPARRDMIIDLLFEGFDAATAIKVMLFDALALGVVASALGVLAGDQISRHLFNAPPAFLELAFPFGTERIVTLTSVVIALSAGILASCVAVLGSTLGSIRLERKPAVAAGVPGRIVAPLAGTAFLTAGIAIVSSGPSSADEAVAGLGLLIVAMLILLPGLLRVLLSALDLASRRLRGVVPFIATADLRARQTQIRGIAVAATGAIAVFATVALQGARADVQRGMDATVRELSAIGPVWAVAPGNANLLATTPFSRRGLAPPRGVDHLDAYRGSFLDIGDRRVWVLGPPRSARRLLPGGQVIAGDKKSAQRRVREGGWATISTQVAAELGVGVGDRLRLPTAVPIRLRVAALTTNLGWPSGAIVLNSNDYARAWGSAAASALIATPTRGTTTAFAAQSLRRALGSGSGLIVQTAAERERDQDATSRQGMIRLKQIAVLVLVCAVTAMAAVMVSLIWQRRPFLASVKAEGYSAGELWRSLVLQAALLVGTGCGIGGAFGLLGQRLLSHGLADVTGFPLLYAPACSIAVLSCLAVSVIVSAIVAAAGYPAVKVDPEVGES
jgi:putative ABC transport system permease protein